MILNTGGRDRWLSVVKIGNTGDERERPGPIRSSPR